MHKLLLTLFAFSSGVLCNAERSVGSLGNFGDDWSDNMKPDVGQLETCRDTCLHLNELPSGYLATPAMGAYKLHKVKVMWNTARKACMGEGGKLTTLKSDAEAALVMNLLKGEDVSRAWVGIHNYFGNDEWVTLTGVNATGYNTWSQSRTDPDNYNCNQHCVTLGSRTGMNEDDCLERFSYVCKIQIC